MTESLLDTVAETLNEVISRTEEVFVKERLTIPASIPLVVNEKTKVRIESHYLSFKRGKFTVRGKEDGTEEQLAKKPLHYRVAAARSIPRLYQELVEARDLRIENIREVVESLEEFVEGIDT